MADPQTVDPAERRAALQEQQKLLRAALGPQYAIYRKIKERQKIGGSEK